MLIMLIYYQELQRIVVDTSASKNLERMEIMRKPLYLLLSLILIISMTVWVSSSSTNQTSPVVLMNGSPAKVEYFGIDEVHSAPSVNVDSSNIDVHTSETNVSEPENATFDSTVLINGSPAKIEYFSLDEVTIISTGIDERALYGSNFFEFGELPYNNIISDFRTEDYTDGEAATLNILSCSWGPIVCDLHIGIYDNNRGGGYYEVFSGGSASGVYTFSNLPESTYFVYVRNVSSRTVTGGSMRYSLT